MPIQLLIGLLLLVSIATAAPPLGTTGSINSSGDSILLPTPPAPTRQAEPPVVAQPSPSAANSAESQPQDEYQYFKLDQAGNLIPISPDQPIFRNEDDPIIATSPEPIDECPPEAPIRLDPTMCLNEQALAILEAGGSLEISADGDDLTYYDPTAFDVLNGGYQFDPMTQPCNNNVRVLMQEAALAGSQVTRGMINTQMDYPLTDPIHAVLNPQPDGYGGSCSIELMTFDILDILGVYDLLQSLENIVDIINAIASFDLDTLFGAACSVINNIFGDIQAQLIAALEDNSPLNPWQAFLDSLVPGFITPLQNLIDVATHTQPSRATIPGIVTGSPLLVSHIPEVGYVYYAQLQNGTALVVHISPTPLDPTDAA